MSATSAPRYITMLTTYPTDASEPSPAEGPLQAPASPGPDAAPMPPDATPGRGEPGDGEGVDVGGRPAYPASTAQVGVTEPGEGHVATSSVSAEAEQGDGPAAASASASSAARTPATTAVSVVVGPEGAAASCPFGVVVVGPHGAAAASQVGVAAVGVHGASSASNAANSCRVAVDRAAPEPGTPDTTPTGRST